MILSFKSKQDFISQGVMDMENKHLLSAIAAREVSDREVILVEEFLEGRRFMSRYPGGKKKEKKHFVKEGEC